MWIQTANLRLQASESPNMCGPGCRKNKAARKRVPCPDGGKKTPQLPVVVDTNSLPAPIHLTCSLLFSGSVLLFFPEMDLGPLDCTHHTVWIRHASTFDTNSASCAEAAHRTFICGEIKGTKHFIHSSSTSSSTRAAGVLTSYRNRMCYRTSLGIFFSNSIFSTSKNLSTMSRQEIY